MDENVHLFVNLITVFGWLMCFYYSCHWVRNDCGCKRDEPIEVVDAVAIVIDAESPSTL